MSIHKYYKISDDGKLIRLNPFCPRCGPGTFMAQNYDRLTCGSCGYTEFKKKITKKPKEESEKPVKKSSTKQAAPVKAAKKKRKKR